MVLDRLGDSLKSTLRRITGATYVDEKLINELVKDIQRSLLQADVNVKLVFEVTKRIKSRALEEKAPQGISRKEFVVNIVYEELVRFLGGDAAGLSIAEKPFVVMLVGLFGNGKTTTAGKLALYYKKRGLKVALVATDTWRPAAHDQILQLAERVGVTALGKKGEKDPVKIWGSVKEEALAHDLVIVDTAGRDALSDELTAELNRINAAVQPNVTLLVMAAEVGQAAEQQARMFHETCGVNGVVITKLDGTAKGGGALTACAVTNAPVRFIGVGEKPDDFEEFKAQGFVGRLLGMGDIEGLLEKAREAIDADTAEDMQAKLLSGEFNLLDLYEQMQAMKKMGPLSKVMKMMPGMGGMDIPKEALEVQDEKLQRWRFIMDSMTKRELEEPDVISGARLERIADGSGSDIADVRGLLKQYKQSKKLVKAFKGIGSEKDMEKVMQKMQQGAGRRKRFKF